MSSAPVSARPPLLRRLAGLCYHRRRSVLAAWVVLLTLTGLAGAAAGEFDNNFDLPGSESQDVFNLLILSQNAGSQPS